jgi:hypothetical protein
MSTQLDPEEEQRRHWYAYVTIDALDQVPGLAVSV